MPRASDRLVHLAPVPALLLAAAFLIALPAAARAATVSVSEQPGHPNQAHLSYVAAQGESNSLSLSVAGEEGSYYRLAVLDTGAAVEPGPMCSAGGSPGVAAICMLHKPERPYQVFGGKIVLPDPERTWEDDLSVELGDGTNSFDAHGLPGEYDTAIRMNVTSGAGNDTISTGGGDDTIDPGAGADVVQAGEGVDRVDATDVPDGPDTYDLGAERGETGEVDYSRRTEPVYFEGRRAGAIGENDVLIAGRPYVAGGSGDDRLAGGDTGARLEGNGGNDLISGGAGSDELVGGTGEDRLSAGAGADLLVGGPGNDRLDGGPGSDRMLEAYPLTEPDSTPAAIPSPPGPSGSDVALGGAGDDRIALGGEADVAYAGGGDDRVGGQAGADTLFGNSGEDRMVGGPGHDKIWGGAENDALYGGRTPTYFGTFLEAPDDGRDLLGCGADVVDYASADRWDRVLAGCEIVSRLRPR